MSIKIIFLLLGVFSSIVVSNNRFEVNKEHLKEELNHMMPDEKFNMENQEEMEFHYFKIHDHNNDNRLDGLELGAAMTHYHEEEGNEDASTTRHTDISDEELSALIEQILKEDDLNDDGYVDYYEFLNAQKRMQGQQDKKDDSV